MGYTITCNECGNIFQIHVTEIKKEYDTWGRRVKYCYTICPKCNKKLILD